MECQWEFLPSSRLVVINPANFPEARLWIVCGLPTAGELTRQLFEILFQEFTVTTGDVRQVTVFWPRARVQFRSIKPDPK